jgi:hypothetical protein
MPAEFTNPDAAMQKRAPSAKPAAKKAEKKPPARKAAKAKKK